MTGRGTVNRGYRSSVGWHVLVGVVAIPLAVAIAANVTVVLGQRLLALGTLAVIVAWYALVSRQAMEDGDERWGALYFGALAVAFPLLLAIAPLGGALLFALCPQLFVMVARWRIRLPLLLILYAELAWAMFARSGVSRYTLAMVGVTVLVPLTVTILVGAYLTGIREQNRKRATLIEELTRTRAALARAGHEAGVHTERERLAAEIHVCYANLDVDRVLMSFLPLHAAGEHRSMYDGSTGAGAIDRVVSSYAPTLRALATAARRADAVRGGAGGLLVVAPETPGTAALPQVPGEVAGIRGHRPGCTVLFGAQATKERILQEIPRHAWFHFAGHGTQNIEIADSASLVPHDYASGGRRLGLSDLGDLSLDKAQLAFLSACRTAVGHLALADEHTHLAGLLQAVGFPHVVGTRWTVRDGVSAAVATEFHRLAALHGSAFDPALGLHRLRRDGRTRSRTDDRDHVLAPRSRSALRACG
ncbi:CHAT domain-containing protein, partial [Streptomyces sp. NPDC005921]